jgi:hypothetical protein
MNENELLGKKRKLAEQKNNIMNNIYNKIKLPKEAEIKINTIKKDTLLQNEKLTNSINNGKILYFQSLKDNQE